MVGLLAIDSKQSPRWCQSGAGPGRAPDRTGREISGPRGPEISLPDRSGARPGPAHNNTECSQGNVLDLAQVDVDTNECC